MGEPDLRQTHVLMENGINYDVGTNYVPDRLSRPVWNRGLIERDMHAIRDELHCNSVIVYGARVDRLVEAAEVALTLGLEVWLQPRLIDSTPAQVLDILAQVATAAEDLRRVHPDVGLNLGCEFSLFSSGALPGRNYRQRTRVLTGLWWLLLPLANRRLRRLLRRFLAVAREHFHGRVTYASGAWESVNWTDFDAVGVNYYMDARNRSHYAKGVARLQRHGKPVIITEFGCCAYEGADARGPTGDRIADWTKPVPEIRPGHVRNEDVQAEYLATLVDIFRSTGVHGAFVFEFIEPLYPHSPDPRHDLDMASFGIVKVCPPDNTDDDRERREPKAAFHRLAGLYGSDTDTNGDPPPSPPPVREGEHRSTRTLSPRAWGVLLSTCLPIGMALGILALDSAFSGVLIGWALVGLFAAAYRLVGWARERRTATHTR